MERTFFLLGCLSGLISVIVGAFGAHALKDKLPPDLLAIFEVGVRYQMYHALALLAVAWAYTQWQNSMAIWAGWLFVGGTILFSGSLYVLSLSGLRWLGAITPLGGLMFILGWALLAWSAWKRGS